MISKSRRKILGHGFVGQILVGQKWADVAEFVSNQAFMALPLDPTGVILINALVSGRFRHRFLAGIKVDAVT
jgi:hypothetical protein